MWPKEAIHVKFCGQGGAKEYFVSEISDRKLPSNSLLFVHIKVTSKTSITSSQRTFN